MDIKKNYWGGRWGMEDECGRSTQGVWNYGNYVILQDFQLRDVKLRTSGISKGCQTKSCCNFQKGVKLRNSGFLKGMSN